MTPVMYVFRSFQGLHSPDERRTGCSLRVECPGCKTHHSIFVVGEDGSLPEGPCWEWDGNEEKPTISPSLLVHHGEDVCHSFIRAGKWEYLPDSTHELAGKTVDMIGIPDWLAGKLHRPNALWEK